ncbi:hypothetical protein V4R08_17290 (plasmid) [Nitrobacter sp. NHB1]|uniref:hypothetical protein n=1 Tax=Nitrobacter sp. NHB1 TaxID=3119830 RepID=UPI002FFFA9DA
MTSAASRQLVLVVEDEPLLRMEAVEMIRESGFDVIEAFDISSLAMPSLLTVPLVIRSNLDVGRQ